ncbi:MAG TPA: hypothetical protein VGJ94_16345 [Syntrophorhabdaceae bacterium]|jgi:hypothetical protein
MFLFVQSWDIVRGRESEYTDFVLREYLPVMQKIGLPIIGGFHVVIGAGPTISAVSTPSDITGLQRALDSHEFPLITDEFQKYIVNYGSRLLRNSGRIAEAPYTVEPGTWRFNQHYTLVPKVEKSYTAFLEREYVPALLDQGIRVKAEWQGVIGSGPSRILLEGVAPRIQDIASALMSDRIAVARNILVTTYGRHYSSRILAPTGRVEAAFILKEMTKAL